MVEKHLCPRAGLLGIFQRIIRATVLIETLPAAFEMVEILFELKDHSAGLNCGRWDYIFSFIKKVGHRVWSARRTFVPVDLRETGGAEGAFEWRERKKHTPEQIVSLLRQVEVAVANGKTTPSACREGGITEQTYYRWRKEYGGLQVDQARSA